LLPPADDAALPPAGPIASAGVPAPSVVEIAAPAPEIGLAGRLYWLLSLAVIACDQAAKAAVHAKLPIFDSIPVIAGLVDFTHVQNKGVAFGLLNDAPIGLRLKAMVTTALAALALAGIGLYARHIRPDERLARAGLSLILGGAVGNLIDRLSRGFVIDFVDVYWRGWHFWAFNVADASITIGAALVFLDLLVVSRHASHPVSDR
jgi:signal peptidase II